MKFGDISIERETQMNLNYNKINVKTDEKRDSLLAISN